MNKNLRKNLICGFSLYAGSGKPPTDEGPNGFTLVELIVVLASIALLAVTLIPALAGTRPNSVSFQCLNNLRQWGDAMQTMAGDNNDVLPRDGTDKNGTYSVDSGVMSGPGSPTDQYAWFNVIPPAMGEQPLSYYYNQPGANAQKKLPFPGNGQGKIWHCPAAKAAPGDVFQAGGSYGFFSYVMNIDLKLNSNVANGIIGNSAVYPNMPKTGALRNPAATVLLADAVFSPTWEPSSSAPSRNGTFPCNRWSVFAKRHNDGGALLFTDGHSAVFKWDYVYNQNPTPSSRNEKLNPDIIWNPNRDIP
ncbi:MAG TPA: type II secretion system protein [Candidatus Acidoferrum sp.]|nr:type II secretion system protein [Candidatus Acidoferrum sp.]